MILAVPVPDIFILVSSNFYILIPNLLIYAYSTRS